MPMIVAHLMVASLASRGCALSTPWPLCRPSRRIWSDLNDYCFSKCRSIAKPSDRFRNINDMFFFSLTHLLSQPLIFWTCQTLFQRSASALAPLYLFFGCELSPFTAMNNMPCMEVNQCGYPAWQCWNDGPWQGQKNSRLWQSQSGI